MARSSWHGVLGAAIFVTACAPEIAEEPWLVAEPRVLAVQFVPAEAPPEQQVMARALLASPTGDPASVEWRVCGTRKRVSELGPVDPGCLDRAALPVLGTGAALATIVPRQSCQVFGPDRAPAMPGQPVGRPMDPDPTGGYFLPFVLRASHEPSGRGDASLAELRLRCGLAAAPAEQARRYQAGNPLNENPILAAVAVGTPEGPVVLTSIETNPTAALAVSPAQSITLHAAWPACQDGTQCGDGTCGLEEDARTCAVDCATPRGCGGAETYLWFNPETRLLQTRQETLQVSWFSTGGRFASPRTAAAPPTQSSNVFTAPSTPGEHRMWVVLRDDRGGAAWSSFRLLVQ